MQGLYVSYQDVFDVRSIVDGHHRNENCLLPVDIEQDTVRVSLLR